MDKARSRRDVLGAAIGGAAAIAAAGVLRPLGVRAASTAVMTEVDNPTAAETSITNSATGDTSALRGTVTDVGVGLIGEAQSGAGVLGTSELGSLGVAGFSGDPNGYPGVTGTGAGVYGF